MRLKVANCQIVYYIIIYYKNK